MRHSRIKVLSILSLLALVSCGPTIETSSSISSPVSSVSSSVENSSEGDVSSSENIVSYSSTVSESEETSSLDQSVTSIEIKNKTQTINIGDSFQLQYEIYPSYAINTNVLFTSSDESVATVSSKGTIKAIANGISNISVTTEDGNKTDSFSLEVVTPLAEAVSFEEAYYEIKFGDTLQLKWFFTPEIVSNSDVIFSSTNTDVFTISENGLVTPVAVGSARAIIKTSDLTVIGASTIDVINADDEPELLENMLNGTPDLEFEHAISGTSTYTTLDETGNSFSSIESFTTYSDNKTLVNTETQTFSDSDLLEESSVSKSYFGYEVGDAFYRITTYENEDEDILDDLIRYPIASVANEHSITASDALKQSHLYFDSNTNVYGAANNAIEYCSYITSLNNSTNSYIDGQYSITGSETDLSALKQHQYSLTASFSEDGYLLEASYLASVYSITIASSNVVIGELESKMSKSYSLNYGERVESLNLEIDPNDYYFESYEVGLYYDDQGNDEVDVNNIPLNTSFYCIAKTYSPSTSFSYDSLLFTDSSEGDVILFNGPTNRMNSRATGTTTLTVTSIRGITDEITVTIV